LFFSSRRFVNGNSRASLPTSPVDLSVYLVVVVVLFIPHGDFHSWPDDASRNSLRTPWDVFFLCIRTDLSAQPFRFL